MSEQLRAHASDMPSMRPFPAELPPELADIFGMMLWSTTPIAHLFRDAGAAEIPRKCEAEQAFVMHWLTTLALAHGADWRKIAADRINELVPIARARSAGQPPS